MRRPIRALLAAMLLVAGLLAIPAARPAPAAAIGPLPPCRIADVLTIPRDYDSWATTLVDWTFMVGKDYKPPDLVPVGNAGVTGGGYVRKVAIKDLTALAKAARNAGYPLGNISAYRSYSQQKALFNDYSKGYGYKNAITFSARPGHSEHQLGLTLDFTPAGVVKFISGDSAIGRWMVANSWKYGWILSYPYGKAKVACYDYEPWHFRYFGRDLAKQIHDSGLTSREYLWAHFTNVDPTTGLPIVSPTPGASASAAPSGAEPSPGPSDAASGPPPASAAVSPTPAGPPASPAGTWFGLDPALLIAAGLIVLAGLALLILRAARLRQQRARRAWRAR